MQCRRKEKVRGNFPPSRRQQRASRSSSMGLVCAHLAFPPVLPTHEDFSILHSTKAYVPRFSFFFLYAYYYCRYLDHTGSESSQRGNTASKNSGHRRRECSGALPGLPLQDIGNIAPPSRCSLADFSSIIFLSTRHNLRLSSKVH